MKKRVVWITGSMSAGKSTQRRLLCEEFATKPADTRTGEEKGKTFYFTYFGSVSCIGKVKPPSEKDAEISMCDGLDSVFGKVKKEGGIYSVDKALQASKLVVLEGSQTSPSWATELQPILQKHDAELYLVHLYLSYEQAFNRLKQRQISKLDPADQEAITSPLDYELTDKNIESIIGKCRQFNNCYDKVKGLCHRLRIDARKTKKETFEEILNFIFSDL